MDINKEKHPPVFCPNCGRGGVDVVMCRNNRDDLVYDTYCNGCEWSGDISPDKDLRYFREEASITLDSKE